MTQVFFTFANEDKDKASGIIDAIERAGFSVWHPNMISLSESHLQRIDGELEAAKCVVALWSAAAAQSKFMQTEIQHLLRAWSSNRLVLAVLDEAQLPIGLRDLPAISIKGAAASVGIKEVIDRVRIIIDSGTVAEAPDEPMAASPRSASRRWSSRPTILGAVASVVLVLLIGSFLRVSSPPVSSPVSSDSPSHVPDLPVPPPDVGPPKESSSPSALPYIAMALATGLAIGALVVWGWTVWSRRRAVSNISNARRHSLSGSDDAPQIFVSYSHQDRQIVNQLVEQMSRLGYTVWIDRHTTGSQRYAAPIVRAIRTSRLVALMCSAHAFASDHVIREIYVAGDNKKPFIAFLIDPTDFPDEVLYFISGFPRIPIVAMDREQLRSEIARLIVP